MRPHHQRVVERLAERLQPDPAYLALIAGGSIARGWERDDSDVDVIVVATDEEIARRRPTGDYSYFTTDLCDYPGGYIDGKVVSWDFLVDVAERGSEPARAAFVNASIVFTHRPELGELLRAIPVYPEHERTEKLRSFHAQVQAMQWYIGEAEKRGNRYLLLRMTSDLVLYAARLILAHNRILYPYHKWLMQQLHETPDKPDELLPAIDALLAEPSRERADALCAVVLNFAEWPPLPEGWGNHFMHDVEWAWRHGQAPLADR